MLGEWIVSRSAKPHYRNRLDASVSGGERETLAADDQQKRRRACRSQDWCIGTTWSNG